MEVLDAAADQVLIIQYALDVSDCCKSDHHPLSAITHGEMTS